MVLVILMKTAKSGHYDSLDLVSCDVLVVLVSFGRKPIFGHFWTLRTRFPFGPKGRLFDKVKILVYVVCNVQMLTYTAVLYIHSTPSVYPF